jgi:hypothetical protein
MTRAGLLLVAAVALASATSRAADDRACELCSQSEGRPLTVEVESGLQFSRLALRGRGDGDALIDPETGEKRVGANMIDLGGLSFEGRARVTGEPLRPVRIDLPPRVLLRSADGAEAELTDFVTDLPPVAMLDENGALSFAFGARIATRGARGGQFRGRIPIRVEYY